MIGASHALTHRMPLRREVVSPTSVPPIASLIAAVFAAAAAFAAIDELAIRMTQPTSWRVQGVGQCWVDVGVPLP